LINDERKKERGGKGENTVRENNPNHFFAFVLNEKWWYETTLICF